MANKDNSDNKKSDHSANDKKSVSPVAENASASKTTGNSPSFTGSAPNDEGNEPLPGGTHQMPADGSGAMQEALNQEDTTPGLTNYSGTVGFDSAQLRYSYPDIPPGTHKGADYDFSGNHPAFGPVPETGLPGVNVDPTAQITPGGTPITPGSNSDTASQNPQQTVPVGQPVTGQPEQPSPNNPGPAKGV